ncbi:MAG: TerB family tellurite resistance protein [Bacteriovoracales bacterium]|nr:TerB family tellurite resistance protein [Bacteriovoracales bacterium]
MKIWKSFFPSSPQNREEETLSSIHKRLMVELSELEEKDHILIACLSGLLARLAFVDLDITEEESHSMVKAVTKMTSYSETVAKKIVLIAQEEINELVDHENHLYTRPLNKILSKEQKENTLKLLFQVAAADGKVENLESEEIRRIAKELRLSHEQFVQAKLTVRGQIEALAKRPSS